MRSRNPDLLEPLAALKQGKARPELYGIYSRESQAVQHELHQPPRTSEHRGADVLAHRRRGLRRPPLLDPWV